MSIFTLMSMIIVDLLICYFLILIKNDLLSILVQVSIEEDSFEKKDLSIMNLVSHKIFQEFNYKMFFNVRCKAMQTRTMYTVHLILFYIFQKFYFWVCYVFFVLMGVQIPFHISIFLFEKVLLHDNHVNSNRSV